MRSTPIVLVLGLLALACAPPARAQSAVRYLELESKLVERQLAAAQDAYEKARARERDATGRLAEAGQALDRALGEEGSALDRIEELVRRRDAVRAEVAAAAGEAGDRLAEVLALRRRRGILGDELARLRGAPADLPDPLTGSWRLSLEPGGRRGLLDLDLDATMVRGTLGLEDGTFGSVRGTFVDGALRLERVGADTGLDLILEGRFDPARRTLSGTWRPVVVGRGEGGGGTWTATRSPTPARGKGETG